MMNGRVLNTLAGASLLVSLFAHTEGGMGTPYVPPLQRLTRECAATSATLSKVAECADNMGEDSNCKCPDLRAYVTYPHPC